MIFLSEECNESDRIFVEERKRSYIFYASMDADAYFNFRETHALQCETIRNGVEIIQRFADELDTFGKLCEESLWKKFSEIFALIFGHKKGVHGQTFVELYIQVG
jgi:hypothetical protein